MCGIHFIIDKNKLLDQEIINSMAASTQHRGPDSTKSQKFSNPQETIFLAANRLKITDQTDAASQPYLSSDQKYALVFNGEIYNYFELKNILLEKGISFTSESDTEVLFHWLRIYGKQGIKDLNGMFAFIFINRSDREIFAARDRFGIKPLYHFENENYFIASSEIKAILSSGLVKKEINDRQVFHYLAYKYAGAPETFFRNIFELRPGNILYFEKGKSVIRPFLKKEKNIETHIPNPEKAESLITDSLLQQINAKVPLGLLLSGGADSTLLLALAKKEGFRLPTYSIVNKISDRQFGTKDYAYSRMAASIYNSEHQEVEIDFSLTESFYELISATDQPIGDSAWLLTSEICRHASKDVKILLSGAGADEIFAGYHRHQAFYFYLKNRALFTGLMPFIQLGAALLPTGFSHPLRKRFRLLKKFGTSVDPSAARTFDNFLTFRDIELPLPDKTHIENELKADDWFSWALRHDRNNFLVSDVLALSDKASMHNGIELRVPYLNEKLVDYLSGIPSTTLIKNGRKNLLNEILIKHGGEKFARRPKEGFGLPIAPWLDHKSTLPIWEILKTPESPIFRYIDKPKIDELTIRQKRKMEDHGPFLWSVLVLAHWLEQNAS